MAHLEKTVFELLDTKDSAAVLRELKSTLDIMDCRASISPLEAVYADIGRLFGGKYPGYRASNTLYHDLEHTCAVALAALRLIHGATTEGHQFRPQRIVLALSGALFHDTGLIQTEDDRQGSGAKYTVGHEERSIAFMRAYFSDREYTAEQIDDCAQLIRCTNMKISLSEIAFRDDEIRMLGKIIGSADLLAQMADRYYLEKLLLLFKEFEEAGLSEFDSELALLQKTGDFYETVARTRLYEEFDGVAAFMRSHFKDRWNMDRDLYAESISKNLQHLRKILKSGEKCPDCYLQNLRRGGGANR